MNTYFKTQTDHTPVVRCACLCVPLDFDFKILFYISVCAGVIVVCIALKTRVFLSMKFVYRKGNMLK